MEGTSVSAMTKLASNEYAMVKPMSVKISRVNPCTNTIGKNTATVVSVEAMIAPETCFAPSTAATVADLPSFLIR